MIITCIRKRFHVFLHAAITLYPLEKKHPLLCKIIYHTSSSPHIPNIRAFLPFQGKNSPPMPIHSGGETPGTDRLIPGAGFLLARRRMRWIAADTCLSAASCVRSYPPLAFFCKPRGTLPESTKRPRPESPRRVPPLFLHPRPKHDRPQIPKHQRPADPDRTRRKSSLKDSQHTILAHRLHNAFPQRIPKP